MSAIFYKDKLYGAGGSGGGGTGQSVFVGIAVPSSSIGNDNDIYVKRSDHSPSQLYKYFRLIINKNRSNSNYTNLGQIVLRKDDNTELIWANYNATVITNHAGVNANESIDKIIDNTSSTCYTTAYNPTSESPIVIVITTAVEVDLSEFTKYAWYTAKELSQRDMVSWTFSVSNDGVDWEVVDTVNDYDVTTNRSALAYSNAINAHGSGSANQLTIDATYIKINGEWIEVEQDSGGTDVIANPEGEVTDTLSKISIDGVIYEISGGGGGDGYTRTALFESSTGWGVWDQTNGVALSDDIENYDEIEFVLAFASGTDMSKRTNKFGAKWFADNCGYTSAAANANHALLLLWPNQGFSAAWDSTNQKIMMWGRNGSAGLYAVYGIKY